MTTDVEKIKLTFSISFKTILGDQMKIGVFMTVESRRNVFQGNIKGVIEGQK